MAKYDFFATAIHHCIDPHMKPVKDLIGLNLCLCPALLQPTPISLHCPKHLGILRSISDSENWTPMPRYDAYPISLFLREIRVFSTKVPVILLRKPTRLCMKSTKFISLQRRVGPTAAWPTLPEELHPFESKTHQIIICP